jgi:hypothetical protein
MPTNENGNGLIVAMEKNAIGASASEGTLKAHNAKLCCLVI